MTTAFFVLVAIAGLVALVWAWWKWPGRVQAAGLAVGAAMIAERLGYGQQVAVVVLTAVTFCLIVGIATADQPAAQQLPVPPTPQRQQAPPPQPAPFDVGTWIVQHVPCGCGGLLHRNMSLDDDQQTGVARGSCPSCGFREVGLKDATTGEWAWFETSDADQERRAG